MPQLLAGDGGRYMCSSIPTGKRDTAVLRQERLRQTFQLRRTTPRRPEPLELTNPTVNPCRRLYPGSDALPDALRIRPRLPRNSITPARTIVERTRSLIQREKLVPTCTDEHDTFPALNDPWTASDPWNTCPGSGISMRRGRSPKFATNTHNKGKSQAIRGPKVFPISIHIGFDKKIAIRKIHG